MSDNSASYPVEKHQQPTGGYQPVPTGPPGGAANYAPPGPEQPFVVAQGPASVVVSGSPARPSFGMHMCLACFALWCCGGLFGLIAFILIMIAQQSSTKPDSARTYGRWSLGLSITGIVIGIIAIIVIILCVVFVLYAGVLTVASIGQMCLYVADGKCYEERQMSTRVECLDGHWFDNYCYRGEINLNPSTTVGY